MIWAIHFGMSDWDMFSISSRKAVKKILSFMSVCNNLFKFLFSISYIKIFFF